MTKIINRIKQFIDYKQISIRNFEAEIGASFGVISNAIRKDTDIQAKWLTKIIIKYDNINSDWLITGRGEMLKSKSSGPKEKPNHCSNCAKLESELRHCRELLDSKSELVKVYRKLNP